MAKNRSKHKKKSLRKQQPSLTTAERINQLGMSLTESLIGLPRYARILLTGFFTIAMTFATFPLLTGFFRLVAFATRNPDLILAYTFTQNEGTGNVLFAFSGIVGAVFYLIGWRIYVGTVGDTPEKRIRVVWYFIAGAIAVIITGTWLVVGAFSGSTPTT